MDAFPRPLRSRAHPERASSGGGDVGPLAFGDPGDAFREDLSAVSRLLTRPCLSFRLSSYSFGRELIKPGTTGIYKECFFAVTPEPPS